MQPCLNKLFLPVSHSPAVLRIPIPPPHNVVFPTVRQLPLLLKEWDIRRAIRTLSPSPSAICLHYTIRITSYTCAFALSNGLRIAALLRLLSGRGFTPRMEPRVIIFAPVTPSSCAPLRLLIPPPDNARTAGTSYPC